MPARQMLMRRAVEQLVALAAAHFRHALESSKQVLKNDADNAESKIDFGAGERQFGQRFKFERQKGRRHKASEKSLALFEGDLLSDTENAEPKSDYAEFRQWLDQDLLLAEIKK